MKPTPLKLVAPETDGAAVDRKSAGTIEAQLADLALQAKATATNLSKLEKAYRADTLRTQTTLAEIQDANARLHDTLLAFYEAMTARGKKPARRKSHMPPAGVQLHAPPRD